MHARALTLVLVVACSCDGGYAWEDGRGPTPTTTSPKAAALASADPEAPSPGAPAGLHGGLFERCAEGLEAETDPVRDVTRLFAACGPPTGMDRGTEAPLEGAISAGRTVTLPLELRAGRCYRLFAAADPGVTELGVEVRSPHGTVIASDHRRGRLALVQPDRPFCAREDELVQVELRAEAGAGAFALEIGTLELD